MLSSSLAFLWLRSWVIVSCVLTGSICIGLPRCWWAGVWEGEGGEGGYAESSGGRGEVPSLAEYFTLDHGLLHIMAFLIMLFNMFYGKF